MSKPIVTEEQVRKVRDEVYGIGVDLDEIILRISKLRQDVTAVNVRLQDVTNNMTAAKRRRWKSEASKRADAADGVGTNS